MKTSEILSNITASNSKRDENLNQKIMALLATQAIYNTMVEKLSSLIPSIEEAASKIHLEIGELYYHKSGNTDYWGTEDALHVSIHFNPTSKFRFILDNGYDKNGGGRNHKQLQAKSENIGFVFLDKTGIKISINPYSLEIERNGPTTKNVLAEFWINKD